MALLFATKVIPQPVLQRLATLAAKRRLGTEGN
jgi:hypothetical protein